MPKESSLRGHVRDLIVKDLQGFVTNHEDKFTRGIPDTSFAIKPRLSGWLELKYEPAWPKMWKTELRIGLRPEQRIWLRNRWKVIHDAFILVRIEDDIYMFTAQHVDALFYPISRDHFEEIWVGKWSVRINPKEFMEIVCETAHQ